jgi:hypothetical protein
MHVPDGGGVDVMMYMFLDDNWAVRSMDVGMMSVRIDRVAHRIPHTDTQMKVFVWPVPVGRVMLVYMVGAPVVLDMVRRRPMVMPTMAMMPRIVSPGRC